MTYSKDEIYIERCLQLAKNGRGTTSPNPMVGAVIVHNDKIIGEGWHMMSGMPHAEPNAINSVKDKSLLKQSTIYVSLEPCSHYGKTPPCSDLIIETGIPKVVIGSIDSNEKVCGNGILKMQNAGINVKIGVLEDKCKELNKVFFTNQEKKRPYVVLKWAQSSDGFMDYERNESNKGKSLAISSDLSRQLVHKHRSQLDAILIGTNTAITDNPSLTARLYSGKNPTRVIIDKELELSNDLLIFDKKVRTIILNSLVEKDMDNILYRKIDFNQNSVKNILDLLFREGIYSLLVEGGKRTLEGFIDANLWDEALVFEAPLEIEKGLKAPDMSKHKLLSTKAIGCDLLHKY
jgi:diaminohydroxyphosphoribosylaminopyrimidine deaminase / 5-amino-6-(5-phosphoribosylamino)uracil reductase